MEAAQSEMLVFFHITTQHYNPDDHDFNYHCENLVLRHHCCSV